jgi:hypothetical protein
VRATSVAATAAVAAGLVPPCRCYHLPITVRMPTRSLTTRFVAACCPLGRRMREFDSSEWASTLEHLPDCRRAIRSSRSVQIFCTGSVASWRTSTRAQTRRSLPL